MTMMITASILSKIIDKEPENYSFSVWAGALNKHMAFYGINTPKRIAAFLAQIAHESGGFSRLVENLNYSADGLAKTWPKRFAVTKDQSEKSEGRLKAGDPNHLAIEIERKPIQIANHVYANRNGNGDEASGDGWKFRGRGLIQLTFKNNYLSIRDKTGLDIYNNPDLLLEPDAAVKSACAYWDLNKLNRFENDFISLRKAINGGLNGIDDCIKYHEKAKKALEGIY
jgi:putative chitinase